MALRPFLLRPTHPLHALFSPSASTRLRASISTLKGAPGQPHDDGCQKPAAHTPAPSGFGNSSSPSSPSGPAGPGANIGPRAAFHRPAPVAPTSYYRRQHSTQLVHPPPVMHGYEPSGEPEPAAGSPQQQDGGAIVTPMDDVHALPRHFHHLSNELLFHLAKNGVHGACKERLLREIMRVDACSWEEALAKVDVMNRQNDEGAWLVTAPYKLGVTVGILSALASIPLVFDLQTVLWFNDRFVGHDLPEGGVAELDTVWKVGSFSWSYMEPLLGGASFVLLGFQFARAQLDRIGLKPYTELLLSSRANRLANRYPMYDRAIVREFAKTDRWDE